MQIRFTIWSKSNEFNFTFRSEFNFNLVLEFQNKQTWLKWMSSFKSTSKALVLIMSIILDMLFVPEWSQQSLILYVLYIKNFYLRIYKTKWIKLLTLSKASKWEMISFVKRICIPEWGISLTHKINCS